MGNQCSQLFNPLGQTGKNRQCKFHSASPNSEQSRPGVSSGTRSWDFRRIRANENRMINEIRKTTPPFTIPTSEQCCCCPASSVFVGSIRGLLVVPWCWRVLISLQELSNIFGVVPNHFQYAIEIAGSESTCASRSMAWSSRAVWRVEGWLVGWLAGWLAGWKRAWVRRSKGEIEGTPSMFLYKVQP